MHSRLFIAALWSPEGKGLTSWLLFVMFIVNFISDIGSNKYSKTRNRKRGHSFKSHLTDWEKPGIKHVKHLNFNKILN